jgi:hypothetical protein
MPQLSRSVLHGGRVRPSTPRPAVAAATTFLLAGLLVGLLTGCSGDGHERAGTPSPPGPTASTATGTEPTVAQVRTVTHQGAVAGRIGKGDRKHAVKRVAGVVDRWLAAAYVDGDYPRGARSFDDSAWPGFTDGATRTAKQDKDLMSNADLGDRIDGLEVKKRRITVDVLAVGRTARAATARVRLAFRTEGDLERKVTVTGRVFLTKKNGKWKIFGYDVAKARV